MKTHPKPSRLLLGFVKLTGLPVALAFFKWKIYYMDKKKQGRRLPPCCILMSNHTALLDFSLYLTMFPMRTIRFLMAEVLFNKGKAFSRFLYKIGGIKVDRDAYDFGFVAESLEVLDAGGMIGVFPQGRLPVGNIPVPFKPSIALIALKTDAPIVPIYTDGRYGLFKRTRVMIGERIYLKEYCNEPNPSGEELERLTKLLEEKEYALRDELGHRVKNNNGTLRNKN